MPFAGASLSLSAFTRTNSLVLLGQGSDKCCRGVPSFLRWIVIIARVFNLIIEKLPPQADSRRISLAVNTRVCGGAAAPSSSNRAFSKRQASRQTSRKGN